MTPDELPDDPAKAIEHLHQLRATRLGRHAECPDGPRSPLLRERVAKARLAAEQELPRFVHRFAYRHAIDEAPLPTREIRKLLGRLDDLGISVRVLSTRKQLVLERRGKDMPAAKLDSVRRSARAIAEYLLTGSRRR